MYMLASFLLLGTELPAFFLPVAVTGAVAVVFSLVLQKTRVDLAMLILDIINNFGDIMSYLRLFALGIASVKVAQAFNGMALDLGGAISSSVSLPSGYIAAAVPVVLILLFGHLLNLVLCILSVLVHGVRLNTLEFSTHVGLKWSGITYKPFALKENKLPVAAAS
jgi:V/A-type H+-transporting ATPase subunit I